MSRLSFFVRISSTHLVLIPSFNTGRILGPTVQEALAHWRPVWVVIDGSTDGSEAALLAQAHQEPGLRVLRRARNGGKGAAVASGIAAARAAGFTHALVMDADGQHPAGRIPDFMQRSQQEPDALIMGRPVFGPEAPAVRLKGRQLSIALVHFETFGRDIHDPLFGFRVYPVTILDEILRSTGGARQYDFDPEMAVRFCWRGLRIINLPAACRYRSPAEGGVSHFRYVRDNARMVWLHTRLITELLIWRWPSVRRDRRRREMARAPNSSRRGSGHD